MFNRLALMLFLMTFILCWENMKNAKTWLQWVLPFVMWVACAAAIAASIHPGAHP